jgi:hypothetical protein
VTGIRCVEMKLIAAEVAELYQRGYGEIYLHSDELNVRLDWSIEVCRALAGNRPTPGARRSQRRPEGPEP